MEKNIYLISYIIFKENELPSAGNMCSEMHIEDTNILSLILDEIRAKTDKKGNIWITNIVKLK